MPTGPADAAKESIITPIFGRAPKANQRTSAVAHKAGLGMGSIEVVVIASTQLCGKAN